MKGESLLRTYVNLPTMAGYSLFLIETIISVFALRGVDLKLFYALASTRYVVVMILSYIVLKERLSNNKFLAVLMIVAGAMVFNL